MERKHMSAFALYEAISANLPPPAKRPSLQLPVKKKKKRSNGIGHVVNPLKKPFRTKKRRIQNKLRRTPIQNEQSLEDMQPATDEQPLDAFLKELSEVNNSREKASRLFQRIINPIPAKAFFRETWEKKPVIIQRKNPNYYKGLFSTDEFNRILKEENIQYGVNLDVTTYTNGKRNTIEALGRALPYTVWDFYKKGCSLRMLNPQAFSSTVWNALSILQEHFGSMVGANVYLTPPGTQGFAPHYDDIEAFILQLEGKKHWRVYSPRSQEEVLPVVSSVNFMQSEIGRPILETVLEAGDLLYFPRGFIHQGDCLPDAHSMHITISSYQKNSWGDLLQKMLLPACEIAMEEDVEYRKGLPLDYLSYMGVQNQDKNDPRRETFISHVQGLIKKLADFAPVDAAVDLKAREFIHDCLPPMLTPEELSSTVFRAPARWECSQAVDVGSSITPQTKIRLIRGGCVRLCSDGDVVSLYYTLENSRVYHKEEVQSLEVEVEHTDALEFLIHSYPEFVAVESIATDSPDGIIPLVEMLFEKGIVHIEDTP